jgi:predicted aminopeptidase
MTLDDCELPEVRALLKIYRNTHVPFAIDAALAALYAKWQEVQAERDKAEAECDRLRATYLALRQQREGDEAVAAIVAVAGGTRSGKRPS